MPTPRCLECNERHTGECSARALKAELERVRDARRTDLQHVLKLERDVQTCLVKTAHTDAALDRIYGYIRRVRRVLRIVLEEEHDPHVKQQLKHIVRKLQVFP